MERKEYQSFVVDMHEGKKEMSQFTQTVEILGHNITNQNQVEVKSVSTKTDQTQVKNVEVIVNQQKLTRITEIQIHDKILKIIDTFTGSPFLQYSETIIDEEPLHYRNDDQSSIKNEKTVDFNGQAHEVTVHKMTQTIFKMFKKWAEKNVSGEFLLQTKIDSFLKRNRKFQHNLIAQLTKDPQLREAFLQFSQTEGKKMIISSKIKDKERYLNVLESCYKMCSSSVRSRGVANKLKQCSFLQPKTQGSSESDRS